MNSVGVGMPKAVPLTNADAVQQVDGDACHEPAPVGLLFGGRLVEQLPAAVFVAVPGNSGEWLYASPRIHDILGYTAQEIMSDHTLWARLLHPEDRQRVLDADADPAGAGRQVLEYRMLRRDGQIVWVSDDTTIGTYGDHQNVYHGLLTDITARKRNQMLLAGHTAVADDVARGAPLADVLGAVCRLTEQISGAARCLIELTAQPARSGVQLDAGYKLIVSAHGQQRTAQSVQVVPPAHSAPFSTPDGSSRGQVFLHYRPGSVVQERDAELAEWSAGLAAELVARAADRDRFEETLALLAATLDSTADGILVLNRDNDVVGHNRKFLDIWMIPENTPPAGMLGAAARLLPEGQRDELLAVGEVAEESALDELLLTDGRIVERYQRVERGNSAEVSIGQVLSFRDVTAHRRMEQELRDQAFSDPLTPLANRALFVDQLTAALIERRKSANAVAVLLLDLDDFKTVNDGLGYEAGDKLLIAVADRLRGCLRHGDTAARLNGDEFAVLLNSLGDSKEASYAAERILTAVARPLTIDGQVLTIRASIGIAVVQADEDAAELLRNADLAMCTAKRAGGSSCCVYVDGMHADAVARMELKSELERAINAEQLAVHYQPIVDLGSGRILGVEALVRWNHPIRGPIPPVDFIPLAEQTGLIERLGRWVLRQACTDAALWRRTIAGQEELSVSVNLSPRQLSNSNFPDEVRRVLWASGLPANALILEITESTLAEPGVDAVLVLNQLKHIGLSLALDDFGTGYSSLAQLVKYPLDVVKVDKSFVDHIDSDPANSALTRAVLNIANALSLSVTVEGIETSEQLRLLVGMGARRGQGYLMARPLPAEEVRRVLQALHVQSVSGEPVD